MEYACPSVISRYGMAKEKLSRPSIPRGSARRDLQVKVLRIAGQLFGQNIDGDQDVLCSAVFRGFDLCLRADLDRATATSCELFQGFGFVDEPALCSWIHVAPSIPLNGIHYVPYLFLLQGQSAPSICVAIDVM